MKIIKTIEKLSSGDELKLAALGDSLTYGWMTKYGYLDYLKIFITKKFPDSKLTIINRGIPGDTARDGLRRLDSDIINLKPDLVLIQFALNDAYTGVTPEDFKNNLETIINRIKEKSPCEMALLTSVALLNRNEDKIAGIFYNMITETGLKYNLPVVTVHEYWKEKIASGINHSRLVQSDGIHPTEKGYELMAEALFSLF